uniref:Uncharacterized protein n=1 Tax=Oryza meridionalis TaxID=40149 RepID=A0A0E0CB20_9ORYZ
MASLIRLSSRWEIPAARGGGKERCEERGEGGEGRLRRKGGRAVAANRTAKQCRFHHVSGSRAEPPPTGINCDTITLFGPESLAFDSGGSGPYTQRLRRVVVSSSGAAASPAGPPPLTAATTGVRAYAPIRAYEQTGHNSLERVAVNSVLVLQEPSLQLVTESMCRSPLALRSQLKSGDLYIADSYAVHLVVESNAYVH